MKRESFFLLLITILLLAGCAPSNLPVFETRESAPDAPLELSGVLQQDLQVSGRVRILGDLLVPAGRTLRVLPGSQLSVLGNDSTKIDPEFLDKGTEVLVHGTLEILGTADRPVSFRLDPETPAEERWAGIELVSGGQALMQHVDISGAETGILALDASLNAAQVNLLGGRYGLLLQGSSQVIFAGGQIRGGDAGLLCYGRSQLVLSDLLIVDNQEEGLYLASGCVLNAERVTIARNDLGLVAAVGPARLTGLKLEGNRVDHLPLGNGGVK